MTMVLPEVATAPAMPVSSGMRISPVPCATLVHSCFFSRSTMKMDERSASTTRVAACRMRLSRRSRSRWTVIALATSRMTLSFSTRRVSSAGSDPGTIALSALNGTDLFSTTRPEPNSTARRGAAHCSFDRGGGNGQPSSPTRSQLPARALPTTIVPVKPFSPV